jgi:hypothetical protein
MKYFRVIDQDKMQHYKDRNPPWIKLHCDLWSDPRFMGLAEFERYCLLSLFVIASKKGNRIPADERWLKIELGTSKRLPLEKLVLAGWIADADAVAASIDASKSASKNAMPETETETDPPKPPQGADPVLLYSADFESFWAAYPKHTGKGAAYREWKKLRPSQDLQDKILAAIAAAKCSRAWLKDNGQYIPNPSTWLQQRRWDDDFGGHITVTPRPSGVVL